MNGILTTRAEVEIFGKTTEKEDMIPVEFEENIDEVSFNIKDTEFAYDLLKRTKVFAISIPKHPFERQSVQCEINEGRFTDKFKLTGFERKECDSIDCPAIKEARVIECEFLKEDGRGNVLVTGKILKES